MIYTITISTILAYFTNKYLHIKSKEINKITYNTSIIYFLTISLSILIYQKYGLTPDAIRYIFIIPFLLVISIIAYQNSYIYDISVLSGIIIQGVILISSMNMEKDFNTHISAPLIGFIISFILAKITKGLGDGDIGLFVLCSLTLGHNYSVYLIFLSYIVAFIYCIYMILTKKKSIKENIPFAPFISLATILIILTGNSLLISYFNIVNRVL
ncbi:prepilin peptidase [Romboutsia sp. Marseille-P6047]|uniref:prepilin peptidase n=1 Tax=Romboutsia sp. Marseille-P6047 TaxID=2161817 RepID=UPI000F06B37E|nr:prepilin peptidase [Romboutsia sp. Marseille-P6047]